MAGKLRNVIGQEPDLQLSEWDVENCSLLILRWEVPAAIMLALFY